MLILALIVLGSFSFGSLDQMSEGSEDSVDPQKNDIIIISANLLRSDHMPCYGYHRNTTPNICQVAEEGVLFEQAVSTTTWSLPAYGSLFTSQYPGAHGLRNNEDKLSEETIFLPENMKESGYKTAAFVGSIRGISGQLMPKYGFDRGFDTYHAKGHLFKDTIPGAKRWLLRNDEERKFLFLHGQDLHYPWNYPARYEKMYDEGYNGVFNQTRFSMHLEGNNDSRVLDNIRRVNGSDYIFYKSERIPLNDTDLSHINARYDAGARYTDYLVGDFLKWLKKNDMYENSTIVITSDHGTNLGDRSTTGKRVIGHGKRPYEEQIRIPVIIKPSSSFEEPENKRFSSQIGLIDIMPTVLDISGIEIPEEAQGISLKSLIWEGEDSTDRSYLFAQTPSEPEATVRTNNWKLIDTDENYMLYNLESDPEENKNLYGQRPEVTTRLKNYLEKQRLRNLKLRRNTEKNADENMD